MIAPPATDWQPGFLDSSALFAPLRGFAGELPGYNHWPSLACLQGMLQNQPVSNVLGQTIQFVPQDEKPKCFEQEYEPRIYLTGEVQTRTENWHDLFNALVWLAFPRAKAALNARHYCEVLHERDGQAGRKRGLVRDRLTQFDESGVVILCADPALAEMLAEHQWRELFWQRRAQVGQSMRFLVFGHSLHEKALTPYPGLTGKSLLFAVEPSVMALGLASQVELADSLLAGLIGDEARFGAHTRLQPLPLLGVPGWTAENESPVYYEDTRYFRPKRT